MPYRAVGLRLRDGAVTGHRARLRGRAALRPGADAAVLPRPLPPESVTVYDRSGAVLARQIGLRVMFFGVISDVPIGRVVIDEWPDDGDAVGYDRIRLGRSAGAERGSER